MVKNSHKHTPKPCGKLAQKSWSCYSCKGWADLILRLRMGCYLNSYVCKGRWANTFGNIVYKCNVMDKFLVNLTLALVRLKYIQCLSLIEPGCRKCRQPQLWVCNYDHFKCLLWKGSASCLLIKRIPRGTTSEHVHWHPRRTTDL